MYLVTFTLAFTGAKNIAIDANSAREAQQKALATLTQKELSKLRSFDVEDCNANA